MDGRIAHSDDVRIEASKQFALGYGYFTVAKFLGLPLSTARTWQDAYRQGHLLHFETMRENKVYPQELKVEAVEKFLAGTSKTEILLEFGITTRSVFDKWVAIYRKDGPSALAAKPKGRRLLVEGTETLEAKVYRLEMENALLKKFQALMTEEEAARPSKRKRSSH
ncbi:MAG: helix-turn-helix domain-containing protein [Polynucleobacter sp.]|uniref:helix-turn-helix domain-containing protein n=1 Tax=Polynucleobacter sp. TaxID=2029855 RepID=UPI002726FFFC|nr:helix-turn-helix domain-containing protein [Polynucleobacter sp.]MDO8713986.1 helix-turn-helix domain-containing protein [Polynucleobacter sp.]